MSAPQKKKPRGIRKAIRELLPSILVVGGLAFFGLGVLNSRWIWRFDDWRRDLLVIIWPIAFLGLLQLVAIWAMKERRVEDAYPLMRRAALMFLLCILCVWLAIQGYVK